MNTSEKLRFLADRAEDGKEFIMGTPHNNMTYKFMNDKLLVLNDMDEYQQSILKIDDLLLRDLKLKPPFTFTEDEKAILRNLPQAYKWIVRDADGDLKMYDYEPAKAGISWVNWNGGFGLIYMKHFGHIFQSIQWSDEEPCEFRKYL